jgi:hypothetical protein
MASDLLAWGGSRLARWRGIWPERAGEDHYRWARDRAAPPGAGLIRVIGLDPHRHRVGLHAIVAAWAICSAEGDVF